MCDHIIVIGNQITARGLLSKLRISLLTDVLCSTGLKDGDTRPEHWAGEIIRPFLSLDRVSGFAIRTSLSALIVMF
jgi:hypothetical protein